MMWTFVGTVYIYLKCDKHIANTISLYSETFALEGTEQSSKGAPSFLNDWHRGGDSTIRVAAITPASPPRKYKEFSLSDAAAQGDQHNVLPHINIKQQPPTVDNNNNNRIQYDTNEEYKERQTVRWVKNSNRQTDIAEQTRATFEHKQNMLTMFLLLSPLVGYDDDSIYSQFPSTQQPSKHALLGCPSLNDKIDRIKLCGKL
uniref:Uncharacterized protein n=1 Tax=Glossina austeni TaxID=7395 RepID=A0A1A9UKP5_GLOAU